MQGFNRYYPPDFDPRKEGSLNKLAGKHALGDRARKIDQGILVVRFELPFNIWCGHCEGHVGMGVRYNAEKKKIGSYYSTPIFSFRCKCRLCAGWFEIQTDPKNTRYVVTEGARQQYPDPDPEDEDKDVSGPSKLADGEPEDGKAFERFERDRAQKKRALTNAERLAELEDVSADRWTDPYELNRSLRKSLREERGKGKEKRKADDGLAEKYGLGEGVRLDMVRSEEERLLEAGEGGELATPSWLSKKDVMEEKHRTEDQAEWQLAQAKRRRTQTTAPPTAGIGLRISTLPKSESASSTIAAQLKQSAAKQRADAFGDIFGSRTGSGRSLSGVLVKTTRAGKRA